MDKYINSRGRKEYITITIGNRHINIKLAGTFRDPYFCGRDVCKLLGYKNINKTLHKHVPVLQKHSSKEVDGKMASVSFLDKLLVKFRHNMYVSESGLANLISNSSVPFAQEFADHMVTVTLPSIKQQGITNGKLLNGIEYRIIKNGRVEPTVFVNLDEMSNEEKQEWLIFTINEIFDGREDKRRELFEMIRK